MRLDFLLIWVIILSGCTKPINVDWKTYLGDQQSNQYSHINQINTENVKNLKIAWRYNANEAHPDNRSQIQCNPLIIDGVLYGTTATQKLIALNANNGSKIWQFDPFEDNFNNYGMGVNRGLMYHEDKEYKRIFYGAGSYLVCINARTGELIKTFGDEGKIDLRKGMSPNNDLSVLANSPGVVFKNLLIIGGRVSESTGAAAGHIRAFDVNTGEQRWIFHTIPKPEEYGYETWPQNAHNSIGGANVWTGMALDEENGIVYCPTGSASYDFYGGDRAGENLFANCLIALNAMTGERIWHFQTIHHDIWDKDIPSPPNLIEIIKNGEAIPAVVQTTKNGLLYAFNRLTGEPIYPIKEIEVTTSNLKGEQSWSSQPLPTVYPKFARTQLTEKDLATRSDEVYEYAKAIWQTTKHSAGMYEPPSEVGTIVFPGFDGGAEWGGAAFDPIDHNLIVNSNEIPWRIIMDKVEPASQGQSTYKVLCQNCHGEQFEGNQLYGNVPSLVNLKSRLTLSDALHTIANGRGVMPSFNYLEKDQVEAIYNYINNEDSTAKRLNKDWPYPYAMRGYEKLNATDGYPIIDPPWGQLTSINMDDAKINWQIPLGEHAELSLKGIPITGTENYGGPIVTAGGLIFIAATKDEKIRAFNKTDGTLMWEHDLPAAGYATPATYMIDNKQYVVIACGGGKLGTKSGDTYIAFSL